MEVCNAPEDLPEVGVTLSDGGVYPELPDPDAVLPELPELPDAVLPVLPPLGGVVVALIGVEEGFTLPPLILTVLGLYATSLVCWLFTNSM